MPTEPQRTKFSIPPPSSRAPATIREMRIDRGRSYYEVEDNRVVLWDLDLSAWLLLKGLGIVECWREGSEFRLVFFDPDHRIRHLHLEFLNSESAKFASAVKQLKKAAHSIGQRPPRR